MVLGGAMLLVLSRVFRRVASASAQFRCALPWLCGYLIVFADRCIGFTAFIWLLARMPATRVSSHAYVNPVGRRRARLLRLRRRNDYNSDSDWERLSF